MYYANKNERTIEEEKQSVKRRQEQYENDDYYNWLIILKENNKIIGSIKLTTFDRNDSVEVNYAIDDRYTRNGYMTEALQEVKRFLYEKNRVI